MPALTIAVKVAAPTGVFRLALTLLNTGGRSPCSLASAAARFAPIVHGMSAAKKAYRMPMPTTVMPMPEPNTAVSTSIRPLVSEISSAGITTCIPIVEIR